MRRRRQEGIGLTVPVTLMLVACAACGGSRGGAEPAAAPTPAPAPGTPGSPTDASYGTTRNRPRTGLVSRVTQVDIDRAGDMNLAAFIESRLTGVRVLNNRGDYLVVVSGASFQSNVGALVIIDGTEGSLAGLTLRDISAIEVLKDSAASIYGVRGANGVLLVTTKKR